LRHDPNRKPYLVTFNAKQKVNRYTVSAPVEIRYVPVLTFQRTRQYYDFAVPVKYDLRLADYPALVCHIEQPRYF
jgi:hypothetical protein